MLQRLYCCFHPKLFIGLAFDSGGVTVGDYYAFLPFNTAQGAIGQDIFISGFV